LNRIGRQASFNSTISGGQEETRTLKPYGTSS